MVHGGAVWIQPEGGRENGDEIRFRKCGTYASHDLREVFIVDEAHVFLAQSVNSLDKLGP